MDWSPAARWSVALAAIFIRLAVRSGLKPLDRLASGAAQIDAQSLETRLEEKEMPDELRPIAETLNDLLARLESSFARERRFSADLAHELRTPVASLKSLGEVALKWPEQATSENYKDVCEIAGRMADTIESMLLLARLEEGSLQAKSEPLDLIALVNEQVKLVAESAAAARLDMNLNLSDTQPLSSDRELLSIVISNLLRNAVTHAPYRESDFDPRCR